MVAGSRKTTVRGVITSWAVRSSRARTLRTMLASSAEMLPSSALICASCMTSSSGAAKTWPDGLTHRETCSTSQTMGVRRVMVALQGSATIRATGRL